MSKARLYFDGDNSGIEKNERTYGLTQEVEDKIDSIDTIETTLQGEIDDLQDQINNLASRGRYLSTRDAVNGWPETPAPTDPYVYRSGDYYIVSVVDTVNNPPQNFRPYGGQYNAGDQSHVPELATLNVNDLYIYDGTQWILQAAGAGANVAWGTIVGVLSNQSDLQTVLANKANITDVLTKTNTTSYTPTANYHPATKKYVDDNAVTFKPFLASFNTTGTTTQFLSSIATLNLPVGSAYLGQVSLSDMPAGVAVQGDVEVYVYPQNVIYAVMRSAEIPPYIWVVDSYSNSLYSRSWTPEANLYTGSSAPTSSATEGMLWYDTVNDVVKAYNGSSWIQVGYTPASATSSAAGIVKLGSDTVQSVAANAVSSTASRTYAVQNNSNGQMVVNVPWTGGSNIEYKTQAEYTALLPGAASDGKHYVIYHSTVVPPTPTRGTGNIQGMTQLYSASFSGTTRGTRMSNDGTTLLVGEENGNRLTEYSLSTPYDVASATEVTAITGLNSCQGACFNDDGTILTVGYDRNMKQFSCPTPYHLTGASETYSITSISSGSARQIFYTNNGNTLFLSNDSAITQYSTSSAYNPTNLTQVYQISTSGVSYMGIAFNHDGTTYVTQDLSGNFKQYQAETPFNISSNDTLLRTESGFGQMLGICYTDDFYKMVFCTVSGSYVKVYDLPNS